MVACYIYDYAIIVVAIDASFTLYINDVSVYDVAMADAVEVQDGVLVGYVANILTVPPLFTVVLISCVLLGDEGVVEIYAFYIKLFIRGVLVDNLGGIQAVH